MVGIEGIYLDPVTSISGIRFLQPREQELFLDNKGNLLPLWPKTVTRGDAGSSSANIAA